MLWKEGQCGRRTMHGSAETAAYRRDATILERVFPAEFALECHEGSGKAVRQLDKSVNYIMILLVCYDPCSGLA